MSTRRARHWYGSVSGRRLGWRRRPSLTWKRTLPSLAGGTLATFRRTVIERPYGSFRRAGNATTAWQSGTPSSVKRRASPKRTCSEPTTPSTWAPPCSSVRGSRQMSPWPPGTTSSTLLQPGRGFSSSVPDGVGEASPALIVITACTSVVGDAGAEDRDLTIAVSQRQRTYVVHLPPRRSERGPRPVVLAFHGGGGNATGFKDYAGLDAVADREGFVVIYPDGSGRMGAGSSRGTRVIAAATLGTTRSMTSASSWHCSASSRGACRSTRPASTPPATPTAR